MTASPPRQPVAPSPRRNYALSALIAAATLTLLLAFAPPVHDLRLVKPDRIVVMEPGEQHQARHPASANWALEFPDQFRFATETARQRAAHVHARDVSPEERQWHFQLTEGEVAAGDLAIFVPNAAGTLALHVNGAGTATGQALPVYYGPGIGDTMLAADLRGGDLTSGLNRVDILQSADRRHIGIRAIYLGTSSTVSAAAKALKAWIETQRIAAASAAAAGLIGALLLLPIGKQQIPAAAFGILALTQLAMFFPPTIPLLGLLIGAATLIGGGSIVWCRLHPYDWLTVTMLGLALPAVAGAAAALVLVGVDVLPAHPAAWLQLANNGARPLLLIGAPLAIWRDGKGLIERVRQLRAENLRKDFTIAEQQAALDAKVRRSAVLEERQRFARDMHDGIGGHLQGLLMRVRSQRIDSGAIADELQSGLADLRLMVDSLDQVDASLFAALANFRVRVGPQLEASGVALDWQLDDRLRGVALDPRATLSLYRILQELVSNCIRHAGASGMSIALGCDTERVLILAQDNGRGFDPLAAMTGRGLSNMRERITRMKGEMTVQSVPGKTAIVFSLPFPP